MYILLNENSGLKAFHLTCRLHEGYYLTVTNVPFMLFMFIFLPFIGKKGLFMQALSLALCQRNDTEKNH